VELVVDFPGGARVDAHVGHFLVPTDQPPGAGGEDTAPSPFSVFLASLGACAGYYVLSFCRQRHISTAGLRLIETVETDTATHRVTTIRLEIQVPPDFPAKYEPAVIRAAEQCAVKKLLDQPPAFEIVTTKAVPA
jgi:ribosomal protein S12 methylthiotransferase accessory factor